MTRHARRIVLVAAVAALAAACSGKGSDKPTRETVLPILMQEAQSLKRDGEKPTPGLGVKSTWNIVSVDVKERPKDDTKPFTGTIQFKINSEMKEFDGSTLNQQTEKTFTYIYNATLKQWVIQYKP